MMYKFFKPFHIMTRTAKVKLFLKVAHPGESVLDVGGGHGLGEEFEVLRKQFSITRLNIDPKEKPDIVGDACNMPVPSKSYDWVFSNAVLEHVGNLERQLAFAREVRRVARKGYFVATPNSLFPIDPHTYVPYYHSMPEKLQRAIVANFRPGHLSVYEYIYMLSPRKVKDIFPEATVKVMGMGTNIVAYSTLS